MVSLTFSSILKANGDQLITKSVPWLVGLGCGMDRCLGRKGCVPGADALLPGPIPLLVTICIRTCNFSPAIFFSGSWMRNIRIGGWVGRTPQPKMQRSCRKTPSFFDESTWHIFQYRCPVLPRGIGPQLPSEVTCSLTSHSFTTFPSLCISYSMNALAMIFRKMTRAHIFLIVGF